MFGRKNGDAPAPLTQVIPIGKIIEIDKEKQTIGFEEFARGTAKLGDEFEIHRDGQLIGQVKVEKGEDDAILPAKILAKAEAPKAGDIIVRPAPAEQQKQLSEATAFLSQRGRLTLRLHTWHDGQALITHPYIGPICVNPAAFNSLQFK
jgi:hypothetical protein